MISRIVRGSNSRSELFSTAGIATLFALCMPGAAFAQDAPPAQTGASVASQSTELADEELTIEVTATRVIRDGYEAPTPTSVIGADEIAAKAPSNLADFVNELPSLAGSVTPRGNSAFLSAGTASFNTPSLRQLGPARTLVLMDNQRVAPSHITGLVDVNQIPQALVSRVDVVTGGASAGWGSDAVAGVINFVLDREFTGIKGTAQAGVTTYGDDANYNLSLAAGTEFSDGRGHLLFAVEHAYNEGISGVPRDWYDGSKIMFNPAYTATNGQPQLLVGPNTGFSTATPGGIITSGPLRGIHFGPGGVPLQFNYGPVVRDPFMQGGDWEYADFARSGDLDPQLDRQNAFFRASYDVNSHFNVFAQASYGRAATEHVGLNQFNFGNITIQGDNAFIPASVAAQVATLGITSFSLGSLNEDLGGISIETERESWRGVIGAEGDFSAFGSAWDWDVYAQRGVTNSRIAGGLTISANYQRAIDAVRAPSGAIVCRSTLTNPTNGCVPYNIFGVGVASAAARDYVLGEAWLATELTEDVVAGTVRGDPFATWAGPVSVAAGLEYRREEVSGSSDPLSPSRSYFAGNYSPSFGDYTVKEAFVEAVVPLASDVAFAESLDLNGAVRATEYSTSGSVTTWKLGLTYSPIEDITFRATRSRDIRAPNLAELFQSSQASTTSVADPLNGNTVTTVFQVTRGNLNLTPELADSIGVGVIIRPRFLEGFTVSADYYEIEIADAISTVNAATVVSQCAQGNTAFCSQITRNGSNVITSVAVQPVNLAEQIARGIDFEASYRRPFLGGDLTLRALATHFLENSFNNGITQTTDTVGTNSANGTARLSLPEWKFIASAGWESGPLSLLFTARGFSDGVHNTSYIECATTCPASTAANMTINENDVDGALYFDGNVTYSFSDTLDGFLSVDNIANTDPVQIGFGPNIGAAPLSVNADLYDVLGRTFRAGFRFRM